MWDNMRAGSRQTPNHHFLLGSRPVFRTLPELDNKFHTSPNMPNSQRKQPQVQKTSSVDPRVKPPQVEAKERFRNMHKYRTLNYCLSRYSLHCFNLWPAGTHDVSWCFLLASRQVSVTVVILWCTHSKSSYLSVHHTQRAIQMAPATSQICKRVGHTPHAGAVIPQGFISNSVRSKGGSFGCSAVWVTPPGFDVFNIRCCPVSTGHCRGI